MIEDEASKPILPPEELVRKVKPKRKADKLADFRDQRANGKDGIGSYEPEYT